MNKSFGVSISIAKIKTLSLNIKCATQTRRTWKENRVKIKKKIGSTIVFDFVLLDYTSKFYCVCKFFFFVLLGFSQMNYRVYFWHRNAFFSFFFFFHLKVFFYNVLAVMRPQEDTQIDLHSYTILINIAASKRHNFLTKQKKIACFLTTTKLKRKNERRKQKIMYHLFILRLK